MQNKGIDISECNYQFLGFLICKETKEIHQKNRDEVAAMECRLYNDLNKKGARVLGKTYSKKSFPPQKEVIYKIILRKAIEFIKD